MIKTLIALAFCLPLVARQDEKKPRGLEGVGLKQEDVTLAVNRGMDYFFGVYKESELGRPRDYLAALAIVHGGGHKRHKDLGEKIALMLRGIDPLTLGTYELGVVAMLCESLESAEWVPLLVRCVQRLLDLQAEDGSWGYGQMETPGEKSEEKPTEGTKSTRLRIVGGKPLDGSVQKGTAMKRRIKWGSGDEYHDNSVCQYAILGLLSGQRAGLAIDPEAWKRALKYYTEGQSESGGWGYSPGDDGYGSMTCAGISSLAIAGFALGEKEWKQHASVKKGLAWLGENFDVTKNPSATDAWHYYYLYGLERVGRIIDTEFIGGHEWWPEGTKFLLGKQKKDGSWDSEQDDGEILSTSFALLFLTRATPALKIKERKTGPGTLVTSAEAAGGGKVFHIILDCSGSMGAAMGDKKKFKVAQDSLCAIVEGLPDDAKVGLRVYGHHRVTDERSADRDSELLIPIRTLDKSAFTSRVRKLDYNGKTPMTYSLRESVKDLEAAGDEKVTVVLLTDGGETTSGAVPADAARDLVRAHPNALVHVIAFDLKNDSAATKQCEAIAAAGRGRCFPASDAGDLLKHLRAAIVTKLDYALFDKDARKVLDGTFGDRHELPEGKYRIKCTLFGEAIDEELWINCGVATTVTVDLGAPEHGVPSARGTSATIGARSVKLADPHYAFEPAGDEDGSLTFEGALAGSSAVKAKRLEDLVGRELKLGEGFQLVLSEERSLASKSGSLKIESARKGVIAGTFSGTFVDGENEVKVSGTFRATIKKDD